MAGWLAAGDYEVALQDGKVVARTGQGKALKSLPKALADHETVVGLRQLVEWLQRHEQACQSEVDKWMIRSLPVPVTALTEVWADEAWRAALTDLVVVPVAADGAWNTAEPGFLRDVNAQGVGMVNLDGDTVRLATDRVAIPHPVRLPDLDDLREFAADLGVRQGTLQLFREVWRKPEDPQQRAAALREFAGGRYAELRHLTGRATALGYQVRGGYATCRVWEDGAAVAATMWVGADDPSVETETGDLAFADGQGQPVADAAVGPIAWSEGMRMAAGLYAGRVTDGEP